MNYNKISLYIIIFCFSLSFFHTFIVIKKFNIYSKHLFPQTYNTYTHNISKKKKKKCTYNINYYYYSSLPYVEDFNIARDKKCAFSIYYMNHKSEQKNDQKNDQINEQKNEQINEQINEQTNEQINDQTNEQINEQINNNVSNITNVDHIRENQDHNIFRDCNKMIEPKKKKKKNIKMNKIRIKVMKENKMKNKKLMKKKNTFNINQYSTSNGNNMIKEGKKEQKQYDDEKGQDDDDEKGQDDDDEKGQDDDDDEKGQDDDDDEKGHDDDDEKVHDDDDEKGHDDDNDNHNDNYYDQNEFIHISSNKDSKQTLISNAQQINDNYIYDKEKRSSNVYIANNIIQNKSNKEDIQIDDVQTEENKKNKKKKDVELNIIRNLPLISIIGRPNVGKSTIFNRLTRKYQDGSIVLDVSSTRDKLYGEVEWEGYKFELVDTGGLVFEEEKFSKEIKDQILMALKESSVVIFVVDGIHGVDPRDIEICRFLRKYILLKHPQGENINKKEQQMVNSTAQVNTHIKELHNNNNNNNNKEEEIERYDTINQCHTKNSIKKETSNSTHKNVKIYPKDEYKKLPLKVILCVNKCESYKDGFYKAQEFWSLGFGNPFPCSGIHGNGLSEILDECIKHIEKIKINEEHDDINEENTINISFIGKPNTGKSSILNKILNCNRFIVSPLAGTTVDSIDVLVKLKQSDRIYRLIDTAGIQKRKKNVPFNNKTKYEYLLYNRTEKAIKRSDVCILVIDSFNGISTQDINIARKIVQENKSCIICCNKWDLIYNKNDIFNDTKNYVLNLLKPIDFSNIIFISAKTSQRLLNIFHLAEETYKNYTKRVNTNTLNEIIKEALLLRPPIPIKNKSLNIYYAFQSNIKPPSFIFFCNSEKSVYANYTKYLENKIREAFDIKGTPIKIYYKQKKLRKIINKDKTPDKYNLDIHAIQKNFEKIQSIRKT
ncbi:GTP-binding protein, putative [Plasmodium reichenowi]|uniref:GTPase Der n=1 Tax=Plasmodium reichenowi TaxID=5854 RepID=A0A151L8J4_PLARE|nr:GTP-binding protein, putative [Plasmodium reichenowi]KYN95283.1 GTP-binding protein, putative [Plasmodium reichenowi]